MRIASVENNTLNWMSSSSARALDMTNCDSSVRSARDEMRHIVGCSERDVIIVSDQGQNRGYRRKTKVHMQFLCELYEAQAARGGCFVHEQTSESKFENEVCDADHHHARNKDIGGRTCASLGWPHVLKEGQDLSTRACGRSRMHDKLACGCEEIHR